MSTQNLEPALFQSHLLRPGDVVDGRYRIDALLGGGGMASVYRATHVALEQPVAIKVVSPPIRAVPGIVQRFLREARAATQLKGSHVVRVFDVGTSADGAPYMVMELLEGQDLDHLLAARGALPLTEAVDYVLHVCEALAEVHGAGIVHRDLKPANLFLTQGADGLPIVKVIDFGISRFDTPLHGKEHLGLTHPDQIMGSPRYMAPEQMESAATVDARSDIWGIGAVLYELLVGHPPYDGQTHWDIYLAAKQGPPPAPSDERLGLPPSLDAAVLRCLEADPDNRYSDVAELARALAPFGSEHASQRVDAIARVLAATQTRSRESSARAPFEEVALELSNDERSHVRPRVHPVARRFPPPLVEREPGPSDGMQARESKPASFVGALVLAATAVVVLAAGAKVMIERAHDKGAPDIARVVWPAAETPSSSIPLPVGSVLPPPGATTSTGSSSVAPTSPLATQVMVPVAPSVPYTGRVAAGATADSTSSSDPRPVVQAAPPPLAQPAATLPNDDRKLFEERK